MYKLLCELLISSFWAAFKFPFFCVVYTQLALDGNRSDGSQFAALLSTHVIRPDPGSDSFFFCCAKITKTKEIVRRLLSKGLVLKKEPYMNIHNYWMYYWDWNCFIECCGPYAIPICTQFKVKMLSLSTYIISSTSPERETFIYLFCAPCVDEEMGNSIILLYLFNKDPEES